MPPFGKGGVGGFLDGILSGVVYLVKSGDGGFEVPAPRSLPRTRDAKIPPKQSRQKIVKAVFMLCRNAG